MLIWCVNAIWDSQKLLVTLNPVRPQICKRREAGQSVKADKGYRFQKLNAATKAVSGRDGSQLIGWIRLSYFVFSVCITGVCTRLFYWLWVTRVMLLGCKSRMHGMPCT